MGIISSNLPPSLLLSVYFCLFCLFGHWMSVHAWAGEAKRGCGYRHDRTNSSYYTTIYTALFILRVCVCALCSFVWLVDSIYIVCTTNSMAERSTGCGLLLPLRIVHIQQSISLIPCNLDENYAQTNLLLKFVCTNNWTIGRYYSNSCYISKTLTEKNIHDRPKERERAKKANRPSCVFV